MGFFLIGNCTDHACRSKSAGHDFRILGTIVSFLYSLPVPGQVGHLGSISFLAEGFIQSRRLIYGRGGLDESEGLEESVSKGLRPAI